LLLNCSNNNTNAQLEKIITITEYEIINDSTEIISILKKIQQKQESKIEYQDFFGKLLSISFLNNSHEKIYLLKPLRQNDSETTFKNFTASIHLLQASNDSIINSCDVDPPFLDVDPPGKRAIIVRA
jgi:hypothetical protein